MVLDSSELEATSGMHGLFRGVTVAEAWEETVSLRELRALRPRISYVDPDTLLNLFNVSLRR